MTRIKFNPTLKTSQRIANRNLINTHAKKFYGYDSHVDTIKDFPSDRKNIVRYTKEKTKASTFAESTGQHLGTVHEYNNGSYINAYRGMFIIDNHKKPSVTVKFKSFKNMLAYFRKNLPEIRTGYVY